MKEKSSTEPRVWVLNLDAELELEAGEGYVRSARVQAAVDANAPRAASLLRPGDLWLREGETLPPRLRGASGWAFCMTPSARRRLADAGAVPIEAPDFDVLRRVNHRRFSFQIQRPSPGSRWLRDLAELEAAVEGGGDWLLKRPFAHAGRGRVEIRGGLDEVAKRFADASFRRDGLLLEPKVEVLVDYSTHGLVEDGEVRIGPPFVQETDDRGAWMRTRPPAAGELDAGEREALVDAARRAGEALRDAGYFGPFGTDGFRHRGGFCALLEINARFTMGWALASLG